MSVHEAAEAGWTEPWVGIAGAGGLGSNVAAHLWRSGVRRLIVADFDVVTAGNLNRQFYFADQIGQLKVMALQENLRRIDPAGAVSAVPTRLTPANAESVFAACPLVVEAFDRAEEKYWLIHTLLAAGKSVVAASGLGGCGHSNAMRVRRLGQRLIMVGDGELDVTLSPRLAPLSPRVGIAAAMQANCVLALLKGEEI